MQVNMTKTYTLEMTEEEALWLKALLQNPLQQVAIPPEEEDPYNRTMRRTFWDALPELDH